MKTRKCVLGMPEVLFTPYSPKDIIMTARPQRPFRATHLVLTPTDGIEVCQIGIGVVSQKFSADAIPAELFGLPHNLDREKIDSLFSADFRTTPFPEWLLEPDELGIRLKIETCQVAMDIWLQVRMTHVLRGSETVRLRGAFLGEDVEGR